MSVNKLNLPKGKTSGKPGKPGAKRVEGSGDSESSDADLDRKLALQLQIDAQVKHLEPVNNCFGRLQKVYIPLTVLLTQPALVG